MRIFKHKKRAIALILTIIMALSIVIPASANPPSAMPDAGVMASNGWEQVYGYHFNSASTPFTTASGNPPTTDGANLYRQSETFGGQTNAYLHHYMRNQSGERSAAGNLPTAITGATGIYINFDYRVQQNPASNSSYGYTFVAQGGTALISLIFLQNGQFGLWNGVFPDGSINTTAGYTSSPRWTRIGTTNNATGNWHTAGIEIDFATQTATATIRTRNVNWNTGALVGTATTSISQTSIASVRIGTGTRPSGVGQAMNALLDNLFIYTKAAPPSTIDKILPFDFLPQLPPNAGDTLRQSWAKTVYVGDITGVADLGLPPTVDVVTLAGETHKVNVTWALNEAPRHYTGNGFDAAYPGVWTFAGTIQNIPGVAENNTGLPVQLIIDLRPAPTGFSRSAEWLDRGVVAVPVASGHGGGNLVKWRVLSNEYAAYGAEIAFNVYRNGVKLNATPIVGKQNYVDNAGVAGDKYQVELIQSGVLSEESAAWANNYITLNLQRPPTRSVTATNSSNNANNITYSPVDVAAGDVDGDGQYEYLVRWNPSRGQDPGLTAQITGETIYDLYNIDGEIIWRVALGHNITSAQQHTALRNFWDLDESGSANLALKTAVGTRVFLPKDDGTINDLTDTPAAILRATGNTVSAAPVWETPTGPVSHQGGYTIFTSGISGTVASGGTLGRVSNGPEFYTVFDGLTGLPIDTVNYFAAHNKASNWGDTNNNRSDRFGATIAYIPKGGVPGAQPYPTAIEVRGHYGPHFVAAYQLIEGKIQLIWEFSLNAAYGGAANAPSARSFGNHQMTAADVDGDGYDEIIFGSAVLNWNGTLRWAADGTRGTLTGTHGDALHVAAMSPYTNDLWIMTPQEAGPPNNARVYNASSGEAVFAVNSSTNDVGRGVAANLTPTPGFDVWASGISTYNLLTGRTIAGSGSPNSTNFRLYWDGDLLSELLDSNSVRKSQPNAAGTSMTNTTIQTFTGAASNWGTKSTPGLTADLLGDWREEVVIRAGDTDLRVYTTNIPTDYLIYTLMHDPVYRLASNAQGNVYNQPNHLGYYLGEDIRDKVLAMELPVPKLFLLNSPDAPIYDVTFDPANGTDTWVVEVEEGLLVEEPEAPVKENYIFQGWFLGEEEYDFETPVTADITLTAQWKIVTFAVAFIVDDEMIAEVIVDYGSTVTRPEDPVKYGYEFVAWYFDVEEFDFDTPITANTDLVAVWYQIPLESLRIGNEDGAPAAQMISLPRSGSLDFTLITNPAEVITDIVWTVNNANLATVTVEDGVATLTAKGMAGNVTLTVRDLISGISHSIIIRIA